MDIRPVSMRHRRNTRARSRTFVGLIAIVLPIAAAGCALIGQGSTEVMRFTSEPPGAFVFIDSVLVGKTPLTREVSRKEYIDVVFSKQGYAPRFLHLVADSESEFLWMDIFNYFIGGIL